MADVTEPVDPTLSDTPEATDPPGADTALEPAGFVNTDEFEDYDNVDSTTVVLPDDSYDASAVVEGEDGEGCGH